MCLLSEIETSRLQPFCHLCEAEERGPRSRSYPRQGPVNDVAYHGTCEDQLRRQLRPVSRSLTQDATHHLVQSLILSRIDYCNVAFAGLPQRSNIRLQAVINAAASLVLRVKMFDHISTLVRDELQWLRGGERIKFKLSTLVHK